MANVNFRDAVVGWTLPSGPPTSIEAATLFAQKNVYYPHDVDSRAIPYAAQPSLPIADVTTEALWRLCRADVPIAFLPGTYWLSGTFAPGGRDPTPKRKTIYWNNCTLRVHSGSVLTRANTINGWRSFAEATNQSLNTTGPPTVPLPGAAAANYPHLSLGSQSGDNLPPRANTWVFFDVSYSERSTYIGTVTLHMGPNLDNLLAWGASNEYHTNGDGGSGSKYLGEVIITGNGHYGWFGTPKYDDSRQNYPSPFVGCQIDRVRIDSGIDIPIVAGGNTFDDMNVGELNVINGGGTTRAFSGCSYLFGTALECGTLYTSGYNSKYIFDVEQSEFSWENFYLEDGGGAGHPAAAIIKRDGGSLHGRCKLGSTSSTTTGGFVHDVSDLGGGDLWGHERMGDLSTGHAIVVLQARTNSRRMYKVTLPYPEFAASPPRGLPFKMIPQLAQISTLDQLVSYAPKSASVPVVGGAVANPNSFNVRWEHVGVEGAAGSVTGTGGLKRWVPVMQPT